MTQPGVEVTGMTQPGVEVTGMTQPGVEVTGMTQPGKRYTAKKGIEPMSATLEENSTLPEKR